MVIYGYSFLSLSVSKQSRSQNALKRMSPWQDGELALAEFCLKRPRGVVEVGETFSYSEDNGLYDTVMTVLIS